MPRIDKYDFSKKNFKKTEYRSWDKDLKNLLQISDETKDTLATETIKNSEEKTITNDSKTLETNHIQNVAIENVSKKTKGKQKKTSFDQMNAKPIEGKLTKDCAKSDPDYIDNLNFLDDDFRIKKRVLRLNGNEKKVFLLIYSICIKRNSAKTGLLQSVDIDEFLNLSRNSRETAIKRLCKKDLLKRNAGRRGVMGTLNLAMSDITIKVVKEMVKQGELELNF